MRCDVCGNDYDKPLLVEYQGEEYAFDCFECAINKLAPICKHCGIKVIGHGFEARGDMFCSAHCAGKEGHPEMRDRA